MPVPVSLQLFLQQPQKVFPVVGLLLSLGTAPRERQENLVTHCWCGSRAAHSLPDSLSLPLPPGCRAVVVESPERFHLLHTVCGCTHRGKILKVLHLWEPMSTASCKGSLPWHHSLVAQMAARALTGISACGVCLCWELGWRAGSTGVSGEPRGMAEGGVWWPSADMGCRAKPTF